MTTNILLIHFGIFILVICLTLLLLKLKDGRVTSWCLLIVAATPILNILLLWLLGYEFILYLLNGRRSL